MIVNISYESITLFTKENRSAASLDLSYPHLFKDLFTLPEDMLIYWFGRIYVMPDKRNQGEGTLLLRKICEIADEKQFAIFLGINAYGDLNTKQLRKWYSKYGWTYLKKGMMLRLPQKQKKPIPIKI